jgi:hypothetical protein
LRFIVVLLRHGNRLGCVAELDAKRAAGSRDAEVLIAEATDEIKRLLWWLLLRHEQRVRGHLRLDRGAHVGRCAKESVGRYKTIEALVRPLEVVVLHVEREPTLTIREVGEDGLAQKLLPQRLPEALDLAERLRMLRPALHVRDSVAAEQMLEVGCTAPGGVLPSLVGQHLLGVSVLRDAAFDRLDDEIRLLVVRNRPRHEISRVVIHEGGDVQPLMAAELECKDVALPELIRLGSLEAAFGLVSRLRRLTLCDESFLMEDSPHGRLGDPESLETRHDVPNSPRAPLGMLRAKRHHLRALYTRLVLRSGDRCRGRTRHPRPQCLHATPVEQGDELLDRPERDTERHGDVSVLRAAFHRLDDS